MAYYYSKKKFLEASEFLQNVVYINIPLTEDEKIERYSTLSVLYSQINMYRKAAFFKRIAAMQCVAPTNPKPAWVQCYYILLQALEGYRISLDPKDTPQDHVEGWPTTQLRVLHELIYSARKMGNPAIAIRHISYLFHTLFDHINLEDRKELVGILESYTVRCEGGAQTLALENGLILPPVPFYKFPKVYSFKLCPPHDHLQPKKYHRKKSVASSNLNTSPFIYSPIQFGTKEKSNRSKMDFSWVKADKCVIEVEAKNPLPIDLHVENMMILSEGVKFDVNMFNIVIPPLAKARFNIIGSSQDTGELGVLGYQTTVFGCKSNCRFRDLHHIPESQYNVKVVPPLPEMNLSLSSNSSHLLSNIGIEHGTVSNVLFTAYHGQSCEVQVNLKNTGKLPIDMIDVDLTAKKHKDILKEVLVWNQFNINSQLPIPPDKHASFTLYVNLDKHSSVSEFNSLSCDLTFQYSGGEGLEAGYCRQCTLSVQLDVKSVVSVTHVNVSQAQHSSSHCDIELYLQNNTPYIIEISSRNQHHSQRFTSQSTDRMILQIPKCNVTLNLLSEVPFAEDNDINCGNVSFNSTCDNGQIGVTIHTSSQNSRTPIPESAKILTYYIAQHIKNYINVRWKIMEFDIDGILFIDSAKWDLDLLEMLVQHPVDFEITINGETHDPQSRVTVSMGSFVSIECCVTNTSDCDIYDTSVWLKCENMVEVCVIDETSSFVLLGQNNMSSPILKSGSKLCNQWEFLGLCPGIYEVNVMVQGKHNPFTPLEQDSSSSSKIVDKRWVSVPLIIQVKEEL